MRNDTHDDMEEANDIDSVKAINKIVIPRVKGLNEIIIENVNLVIINVRNESIILY